MKANPIIIRLLRKKYLIHKIIIRNKNYKTDDRRIDKYEKWEHAYLIVIKALRDNSGQLDE